MTSSKGESLTLKEVYSEIGTTYRYFLNWRHALLAGYLVVLYGLVSAYMWLAEKNQLSLAWLVFASGFVVSLSFWGIEYRIRDLYRSCTKAGCEIEKALKLNGVYIKLDDDCLRYKVITHSNILNLFFGTATLGMLVGLIFSICQMVK